MYFASGMLCCGLINAQFLPPAVPQHLKLAGAQANSRYLDQSPDLWLDREPANTYPFPQLLLRPTEGCEPDVQIVVALFTIPTEFKLRAYHRRLNLELTKNRIRLIFPLGRHKKDIHGQSVDRQIVAEAAEHGDILLADYYDSYEELPQKTIASMIWFAQNCLDVSLFMKIDSDVVVNWEPLLKYLKYIKGSGYIRWDNRLEDPKAGSFWLGHRWDGMPVIHDPQHKNFEDMDRQTFPPYHSGPAYMLNRKIAQLMIYKRNENTRYLRNEDTMLGILAEGTGIEPSHNRRFIVSASEGARRDACKIYTRSITDCACENWFSYHVGREGREVEAAIYAAQRCARQRLNRARLISP